MTQRLANRRVLVVDDDEDIRESMVLALQGEGANVEQACDGNEAVAAIEQACPEAMVLDLMLPGRSGFLVLDEAQALAQPPVVVMVTANEGRRHEAYARTRGVDAYFTKPTPLALLVECVADLLDGRPC